MMCCDKLNEKSKGTEAASQEIEYKKAAIEKYRDWNVRIMDEVRQRAGMVG